jgi:hypothetical protein
MKIDPLCAIVIIATCAFSTVSTAQTTYKCGNSYSQTACAGGVVIDSADQPTAGQKAQADLATARDVRIADAMEKARLEQEKRDLAANAPGVKKVKPETTKKAPSKQFRKWKKKQAGYFVAQASGQKKKQQASKNSSPKKELAKP